MSNAPIRISAVMLAMLPSPLLAETASSQVDVTTPDDIVVAALRTPVDHDRVASSVTVLGLDDIQLAQPVALTDLLVRTPGLSLTRDGGYGETTELRIRGAGPDQTVVVINGMRMTDQTQPGGNFDFSQLFTDDIARVEILRGPQSILWGANAIGGIINVTTRAPDKPLEADIALEAGSHDTLNAHAGIGGTSALVDWRVSGSEFTTGGIPTLAGSTVPNGYNRQAASATATFHLADNASLDLRGYWNNARNAYSDQYTSYYYAYQLNKQWSAYAGLNVALLDGRLKNRLAMLQNQTDAEDFDPSAGPALEFVGHGRTRRFEYQGSLAVTRGVDLVFGAEREEQRMAVGSPYDIVPYDLTQHTASANSLYGEARVSPLKGLTFNAGLRYDHHSQFGGNTVFSAGAAYTPDGGTTLLRASYDEGFKAPSLYQLYSFYGAADLKPEKAKGWEVGAERALLDKAVHLAATWFERNSSNLIAFAFCPSGGILPAACYAPGTSVSRFGYYANIDEARARGLELAGSVRVGNLFGDANYSIVVAEDRTPGSVTFGRQLPRVPRHLANGEIGYDWANGLTTSVALRYAGVSYDDNYSTLTLASYVVADLRAEWKLPSGLALFGRVENLADRRYQTAAGYNSIGRSAYLGIRGHF